jgi:hypothetical protein
MDSGHAHDTTFRQRFLNRRRGPIPSTAALAAQEAPPRRLETGGALR